MAARLWRGPLFLLWHDAQQRPEGRGDRLPVLVELVPGDVGDRVAGSNQSPIALAIVAEGRASVMALPPVQLDYAVGAGPVAVDLVALAPEHDPVVEAG